MKTNKFYVYQLIDPRTNNPFYVGKGSARRMYSHTTEARGCKDKWINKIKCQIINNIEQCGLVVGCRVLLEEVSEHEAYCKESEQIDKFGKIIDGTGILANIADGGKGGAGGLGVKPVQSYTETGALLRSFKSLDCAASFYKIHKSTICAALNGRTKKAAGVRWGYDGERIEPYIANKSITPVTKYDMLGDVVESYTSIKKAASAVNVTYTSIVDCCRHNHHTAGGFRWAYQGELPHALPDNYKIFPGTKILQARAKTGELVGIYSGPNEAAAKTAANPTGISDCCGGRKKSSGGLCWQWVVI